MKLSVLSETMSVLKLDASKAIPQWALEKKNFISITYTNEELSIVCEKRAVPPHVENMEISEEWSCIKVKGPLDFSLIGILSSLISPLAEAKSAFLPFLLTTQIIFWSSQTL